MIEDMIEVRPEERLPFGSPPVYLDEFQLAEAEAQSDCIDADLEDYAPRPWRPAVVDMVAVLDEFELAEAEAAM
jgi:hypothetical protein